MKWWQLLTAAISSLVILWRDWFSRKTKAKRKAFDNAKEKIDNDADDADLQSDIDDMLSGL